MESKGRVRSISLIDLWEVLVSHIVAIVLITALVVLAVFAYSRLVVTPTYQSKATLYILRRENESDYVYTQSDFTLAKDVVNDCTYVLKSKEVLDHVIDKLDLDMNYKTLTSRIATSNPENTRFLEVSVWDPDPKLAKRIVDCVCDLGSEKIANAMGFDQVNLFSYGDIPTRRANGVGMVRFLGIGAITASVVYGIFLMVFLLDTKITSAEDVTKYLGISVLGEIPNSKGSNHRSGKYQHRSAGGKYTAYRYSSVKPEGRTKPTEKQIKGGNGR